MHARSLALVMLTLVCIALAACAPPKWMLREPECSNAGGRNHEMTGCSFPTSDGGKPSHRGSDCEAGWCYVDELNELMMASPYPCTGID